MSVKSSSLSASRWKKKYYDNLSQLDRKQKDWQQLESVLKKAVTRLSIAAEGQHVSIDRHLKDIRSIVKKQVNVIQLENSLEDISALLLKITDKHTYEDKKVVSALQRMLENIDTSAVHDRFKKKLIKKLSKATDDDSDALVDEVHRLIASCIETLKVSKKTETSHTKQVQDEAKPKLFENIFGWKGRENTKQNDTRSVAVTDYADVTLSIARAAATLPWPGEFEMAVNKVLAELSAPVVQDFEKPLKTLFSLIGQWKQNATVVAMESTASTTQKTSDVSVKPAAVRDVALTPILVNQDSSSDEIEPSPRETLVHLLEQLMEQTDLREEVAGIKKRLESESADVSWHRMIKDVARLIISIRAQMQQEKNEFESFLQQVTGRLTDMDDFLLTETASINDAEQASNDFDVAVNAEVQDIKDDMQSAEDLNDLKDRVEKRLSIVSEHIKQYRVIEHQRYTDAQLNVEEMQSRLSSLEQESDELKEMMQEATKEAMFDALTQIPNRLAYEKRAVEEITRCKRLSTPLCMAVWDVDLFKKVNDTYGHNAGDKVLISIAQVLKDRIRETDFIARYGGEEFVMFMPGIDDAEALKLVDVLREKVSNSKFNYNEENVKITVSCGISSYAANDTHERMFERADKALYSAKHNGRNQCVVFSGS